MRKLASVSSMWMGSGSPSRASGAASPSSQSSSQASPVSVEKKISCPGSFFAFLEDGGRERVQDIGPLDVRDYLEAAKVNGLSTATLKQHMAAVRMLFDHLVTGGVLEHNPALSVK